MKWILIDLHIIVHIADGGFDIESLYVVQFVNVQNVLHPIVRCNFDLIEDIADLAQIS